MVDFPIFSDRLTSHKLPSLMLLLARQRARRSELIRIPVFLGLICLAASSSISDPSVLLNDGETAHPIVPFYTSPDGAATEVSDDASLDHVLSLLDLPQGSADLIDVSRAKSIDQLLALPKSFYGSTNAWKDIRRTNVPPLVLLQLLDEERYRAFESLLLRGSADLTILEVNEKHISVVGSDHDLFPNRRLLKTIKSSQRTQLGQFGDPFILTYITANHLVDWIRVFFGSHMGHFTDDEIKASESSPVVIGDIARRFSLSSSLPRHPYFMLLMKCFILKHETLSFYERFRNCIRDLGLADVLSVDPSLSRFHSEILVRRNELLFRQAFGPNGLASGSERDFVNGILEQYDVDKHGPSINVHVHLQNKIIQYKAFFTPTLWNILCTELQTRRGPLGRPTFSTLVLVGYFLGHVDLLPPFVQAYPELAGLSHSSRAKFDPRLFDLPFLRLNDVVDLVAVFDPTVQMTQRDYANACLGDTIIDSLSSLAHVLTHLEAIPDSIDPFKAMHLLEKDPSVLEPFKSRIYPHLHLVPRNHLAKVIDAVGFEALDFLDDSTCAWFLENALGGMIYRYSQSLLLSLERHFPLISATKDVDWAVQLLKKGAALHELAIRRLFHLMVIRHFDVADIRLFALLLRFGVENTAVFVQLFRKIHKNYSSFGCDPEAASIIQQLRPGLSQWLGARFQIAFVEDGSCRLLCREINAELQVI